MPSYRSALALDAGADDTWANLAEALGAQGKWPEAADALRRASQLMPRDPDYRRDLANALRKSGRHEEARKEDAEARPPPSRPERRSISPAGPCSAPTSTSSMRTITSSC
jgi:Flp pilus assembly protein TadD